MVRDLSNYKDSDGHYMTRSRNPELFDDDFDEVFGVIDFGMIPRKFSDF
jgi:hypothetical protein